MSTSRPNEMEDLDFHNLSRKELQALCKRNKIPANLTNVAMADSLRALHQVEGLDELLQELKSDPNRSPGRTVPGTPIVPPSGRRSTVRRSKPAVVDPVTRTRATTRKTAVGAVAETPVTGVSRRKVPVPEASKFSLDAEGEGVDVMEKTKAVASVAESVQKGSSSLATSVQKVYSSRRSVRLLEKSMAKICLTEDAEKVAGDDSLIAPKEETHGSCRNLDSFLENETEIQDGVSADHANSSLESVKTNNLSEVPSLDSQEENVDTNSDVVEPLPKADYYTGNEAASNVNKNGSIEETVSLEGVEKTVFRLLENETGMNCDDPQADGCNKDEVDCWQEKHCIDLVMDNGQEHEADHLQVDTPDVDKTVFNLLENNKAGGMNCDLQADEFNEDEEECDNVQYHEVDHLQVKTPEKAVDLDNEPLKESEPEGNSIGNRSLDTETEMDHEVQLNGEQTGYEENLIGSPNPSDWSVGSFDEWLAMEQQQQENIAEAVLAADSTSKPALKSIVVMGSNSHHVSSSAALQVSEDTSLAVTETKPTMHTDDIEVDSEDVVTISKTADSTPRPALKSIVVMGSNSHHVSSSAASQLSEDTSPAAVTETKPTIHTDDVEVDSEDVVAISKTPGTAASLISSQFPRPTTTVVTSSSSNKENIGDWKIKMEEEDETVKDEVTMTKKWDELSMRQLSKMLKEKLQVVNKTEKVAERRQAMQTLSDNCVPPDAKN